MTECYSSYFCNSVKLSILSQKKVSTIAIVELAHKTKVLAPKGGLYNHLDLPITLFIGLMSDAVESSSRSPLLVIAT